MCANVTVRKKLVWYVTFWTDLLLMMILCGWHIGLCAIEYSLVDAPTVLKYGDEACLHNWQIRQAPGITQTSNNWYYEFNDRQPCIKTHRTIKQSHWLSCIHIYSIIA